MLKILWFFYDFQDFSFLRSGGSKRAQDVPKTAEDGPKRAPRRPKMAPRGLQEGPSWLQEGSKRAQDGPKGAPRGPKLAPRWLQEGPRWPTWLREPSRTLPGPSQTPPGSDFGTHFVPKTDPRRPKSLRKLCFPVGVFVTLEPLHWAFQVTDGMAEVTSKVIKIECIIERKLATSTTGGWRRRRKQSPQPEPACCGTKNTTTLCESTFKLHDELQII